MVNEKYIAALDVGTTTLRCFIYNTNVKVLGFAAQQVELIYPELGGVEIDPEYLWTHCIITISDAIKNANLTPEDITCIGLTTQRNTFITWDKKTGEAFHNFIAWNDIRASGLLNKWNNSLTMKMLRAAAFCVYLVTLNKRFLASSSFKFTNPMILMRLLWVIKNNEKLQNAIKRKTALYGTIDSWLLYRLRQGTDRTKQVVHITDITNAAASGFYDPFIFEWSKVFLNLFSINVEILPKVVDNNYDFGFTDKSVFGSPIKIGSSISDQSASLWGSCCFNEGDTKLTLGTAAVLCFNSGKYCHGSVRNLVPLVGWSFDRLKNPNGTNFSYTVEGSVFDTGTIIRWAINFGLFTDPAKSSDIANSVPDSDGCFFVPAFSGLGTMKNVYWDNNYGCCKKAPNIEKQPATGILGLRPSTKNEHIVRAVLESLAFRLVQLYGCTLNETDFKIKLIRVDGGVSKNDFICQLLADITGVHVERAVNTELTALGVAFVAGLSVGIWKSTDDFIKLRKVDKVFMPRKEFKNAVQTKMEAWEKAVERFKGWYDIDELEVVLSSN